MLIRQYAMTGQWRESPSRVLSSGPEFYARPIRSRGAEVRRCESAEEKNKSQCDRICCRGSRRQISIRCKDTIGPTHGTHGGILDRLSVTETARVILCCEARTTLKVQARSVLNEFLRNEECTAEEVVMLSTQESSNIFSEIGSKKGIRDCTALAA